MELLTPSCHFLKLDYIGTFSSLLKSIIVGSCRMSLGTYRIK